MEQLKLPLPDVEPDFDEITLDDVAEVLLSTIMDDDANKKITFLGMLSAYTDQSQINISMNAPSSRGKTYLAKEIAQYFPAEDKIILSSATPRSFFYDADRYDKKTHTRHKSLRRKILIFLELPDPELQKALRPLLSHDERFLMHKMTNTNRKATDTTIVEGYPATVFCSANMVLDEQEATRAILISPEATEAKLLHAIHLQAERGSDEAAFAERMENDATRNTLKARVVAIRDEAVDEVMIPNPSQLEQRFLRDIGVVQPKHQRHFKYLQQLIKATALLNVWRRRLSDGGVVASQSDIDQAFTLWKEFFDSQNLNLPPAVLSVYRKYIVPAYIYKYFSENDAEKEMMVRNEIGLSNEELQAYHIKEEGVTIGHDQLRKQILPQLQNEGIVLIAKPKQGDKRSRHIFPLELTDEQKNKVGRGGGGVAASKYTEEGW